MRARIPPDLDGARADKAAAVLAGVDRARAKGWCEAGRVRIDGVPVSPRERVVAGATIETPDPEPIPELVGEDVPFRIAYEDEAVLVVDKPAGVVVHPGAGRRRGTLAAGLLHRYPELRGVGQRDRWGLVHRLDRDTSGLLLVARTSSSYRRLAEDLAARKIERRYLTLVTGAFDMPRGKIEAPIGRDPARPTRRRVAPEGKPAVTHYRVVRSWDRVSLLEVGLETGRTHQIRVHLAAIGHPVVGDTTYGRTGPVNSPRLFLHAAFLAFTHPVSGERISVESPLPADLDAVLAGLGRPSIG